MSIQSVLARIAEIEGVPAAARTPVAPAASATAATAATPAIPGSAPDFQALLGAQTGGIAAFRSAPLAGVSDPSTTGAAGIVRAAEAEVGQAEQPPGSNDSPRIAQYRTATAGAGVGPWCAYFVSWCARQAGTPLGEAGQGFGAVSSVAAWAQRTGRWEPAGTAAPQPGDLIVWGGSHIGIVESVDTTGAIHTIEGNSSNMVARRTYGPDGRGATGYVRMS